MTVYKKGSLNTRADNTSRWFISSHNTHDLQINNANFKKIFTRNHPQTIPWHELRPSTGLSLKLINVLRGKVSMLALRLRLPKHGGRIETLVSNTHTTWNKARIRTNAETTTSSHSPDCRTGALRDLWTTSTGRSPDSHERAGRHRNDLQIGRQKTTNARRVGPLYPSFATTLEVYRREDPPPTPQLALPVEVAEEMMSSGCLPKASPIEAAIGELGLISFYYLLRVGEYTKPTSNLYWDGESAHEVRATRTIQFRFEDITFWRKGKIIKRWKMFHLTDEATMKLTNKKKWTKKWRHPP